MVAPADRLQEPYQAILDMTVSEHLNIYNMETIGLPENYRYDLTRYK